jgi:phosphatidate cytidylyltransferase
LLVAVLFLPLFIWMIFLPNPIPFFGFCLAGLAVAVYELGELVRLRGLRYPLPLIMSAVLLMAAIAAFPEALPPAWRQGTATVLYGVLVFFLLVFCLRAVLDSKPETAFPELTASIYAVLLLGELGICVILLRKLPYGSWWIALLFGSNWFYDAGAFFGGRWFGRRLLAPRLSPRKTVEGVLSGLAVNLAVAAAAWAWLLPRALGFSLPGLLALALGLGLLAQAGDLTESVIKRWSGVKDSAGFIPGHGGILDKIDSCFFTAPVLYVVAWWLLGL